MLRRSFLSSLVSSVYQKNELKKIADEINSLSKNYVKLTDELNKNLKYFSLPNEKSAKLASDLSEMHEKFRYLFQCLSTQMKKGHNDQN